ncbi:MAG TPA: hypothetical protein VMS92_20280, partial [Mycobacterium sp.]|nr:hypothetical protein [Mycobacterium sp.]
MRVIVLTPATPVLQSPQERPQSIVQPRLRGAILDLEVRGDTRQRPTQVMRPPQHGTVLGGQLSQRALDHQGVDCFVCAWHF